MSGWKPLFVRSGCPRGWCFPTFMGGNMVPARFSKMALDLVFVSALCMALLFVLPMSFVNSMGQPMSYLASFGLSAVAVGFVLFRHVRRQSEASSSWLVRSIKEGTSQRRSRFGGSPARSNLISVCSKNAASPGAGAGAASVAKGVRQTAKMLIGLSVDLALWPSLGRCQPAPGCPGPHELPRD